MSTLSLRESLAILSYKNQLSLGNYRSLADWLDCYKYILPSDRVLNHSALSIPPRTQYDILHLYHFTVLLETCYTSSEQSNIIREILCTPLQS